MRKFLFAAFLLLSSCWLMAQGYEIKVTLENTKCDTIHLQSFVKKEFKNTLSIPYSNEVVFKSKTSLEPGIYQICGDTNLLVTFFISDKKNQKFSIKYEGNESVVTYTNSAENSAFEEYLKGLQNINQKMQVLNQEFEEMRNSGMPQYMMQTFVDSLIARAGRIDKEREAYQRATIAAHPTWISSSVIQASIAMPQPPQEYMRNRNAYNLYMADHVLDNFPYEDERFYTTSYAFDLTNQFTKLVWETGDFAFDETERIVNKVLDNCKKSPKGYTVFFDNMERIVGSLKSPYWYEDLYIVMLKNALSYDKLDEARHTRYTKLLSIHDRNRTGSQFPNFPIKLSNDSVIDINSIDCEYVLVYFQNPDCPTCTQVRNELAQLDILNSAIDRGKIKVVTVYFEQDEKLWRNYLKNKANPRYIHGWEYQNIITEGLFDIRIIPFMFLLDRNKKILKKDLLHNEVEPFLKNLGL